MSQRAATRPAPPSGTCRRSRRGIAVVAAVVWLAGLTGCSGEPVDPVSAAQANLTAKQNALATAESNATAAAATFCSSGADYLTALERYGDVVTETAPSVGDVRNAGADLVQPREDVVTAAEEARAAAEQVTAAEAELASAQQALAEAEARAAGQTPAPATGSGSPSPSATAAPASVARVRQAEQEFASTSAGITDQTALRDAAEEFNAAVVALELAWLRLFADAGCLTDPQQEQAVESVGAYTTALQEALAQLGLYEGEIDGVYGPQTVAAVKALQESHDLPQTGVVDRATEAALRAELAASSGAAAVDQIASTAAVQQTLKLAGYWEGEIDGVWTDELTSSIKQFQDDLGVPVTGDVDAATLAALKEAIEQAGEGSGAPTPEPTGDETSAPTDPTPTQTPTG